ncbi:S41 family peptidase [Marixanthomonas spongiae]|uniref:Peptidase S41 n=1 Tax=Marixanthomonas spongiae TaxID=2174845 RepID=A0A2U0I0V6_9FLAO|nr:S41 family peptidase [Marixanthomonas spongiae]PVW14736.1 peptidase S41 [Marixanthomonas spongiae]
MKKKLILLLLIVATLFTSCFEDSDDNPRTASQLEIQDFIYRGLNFFYLYKADKPELADDAFANEQELNNFLSSYDSPESLFDFLTVPQDRFSILVDDYIELENALSGVSKSNGMEFGLVRYPNNPTNVFGYVRYVLPNTDAETKGLQRGDIFNSIDGQQLNENNFNALLSQDSYTIGLATFDGTNVNSTGETASLTKTQYTENPVYIAKTLDVQGQKIGYVMYNSFTRDFDNDLNAAFGSLQADGVTDLVLDLRYNGGGAVETAVDLAGMITGQFNGELFYTEQWNPDRQEEYAENGLFNAAISDGSAINSLGLTTVYILTTGRTASASELVINGLDPYINVVQIGQNTTGKFQASFLLYDAPAPGFRRSQANPDHTYAMLPLVFKTANAVGNTDYVDGLTPDIAIDEDYANLGILGDVNEPFLATALSEIVPGFPKPASRGSFNELEEISESKANSPLHQIMLAEH